LAEKRDDAAQRPLHENGVCYKDEPVRFQDILDDIVKELKHTKGTDERERKVIER